MGASFAKDTQSPAASRGDAFDRIIAGDVKNVDRRTDQRRHVDDPTDGLAFHHGWTAARMPAWFGPADGQILGDHQADDVPILGVDDRQAVNLFDGVEGLEQLIVF